MAYFQFNGNLIEYYGEVVNVMTVLQKSGATDVGLITEVPELVD